MISSLYRNSAMRSFLLCTISFSIFIFYYIYFFQIDLIVYWVQSIWGLNIFYSDAFITVFLTIGCLLFSFLLFKLFGQKQEKVLLSFLPSLSLLGLITSSGVLSNIVLAISIFCGALYLLYADIKRTSINDKWYKDRIILMNLWEQQFFIVLLCLLTCYIGNTERVFHTCLKAERAIISENYIEAYQKVSNVSCSNQTITFLQAYTLNKQGLLGELFFTQSITSTSQSLFPYTLLNYYDYNQEEFKVLKKVSSREKEELYAFLKVQIANSKSNKFWIDYLLTAYLLDKKLDSFVKILPNYYQVNSRLPKHYREALLWYTHTHANPSIVYHDNLLEADYQDYIKQEKGISNLFLRKSKLKDTYGNTYWFYLQYATI